MVEDGTFVVIQSWMVNELELSGNELIIYATIYGFSQSNQGCFNGSQNYLADWSCTTRTTVNKNLKSLHEKGLIDKREISIGNQKFIEYRAIRPNETFTPCKETLQGVSKNFTGGVKKFDRGCKETLHNNNIYNNKDNNNDNINVQILEYLNMKAKKNYSAVPSNLKHINARLKEGYKIEDFKKVVDLKIMQWGNDKTMKAYIRPKTLFSENFDSYLNETLDKENITQTEAESLSSETREKLKNASTPQERISILRDSLRNTEDDIYF